MHHNQLSLLLRSTDQPIGAPKMKASVNTPNIRINRIRSLENTHYVQMDITILPAARAGNYTFQFGPDPAGKMQQFVYSLQQREGGNGQHRIQGVTSRDLTYLILADRFANGDTSNDAFSDMRDPASDRNSKFARHGGDLKGIQDRLDYFIELGVTTLWFTPLTENDMLRTREGNFDIAGYHGYWFTDHYQIDKRFGGNEAYRSFVNAAHQKGLKVIDRKSTRLNSSH